MDILNKDLKMVDRTKFRASCFATIMYTQSMEDEFPTLRHPESYEIELESFQVLLNHPEVKVDTGLNTHEIGGPLEKQMQETCDKFRSFAIRMWANKEDSHDLLFTQLVMHDHTRWNLDPLQRTMYTIEAAIFVNEKPIMQYGFTGKICDVVICRDPETKEVKQYMFHFDAVEVKMHTTKYGEKISAMVNEQSILNQFQSETIQ